MQTLQKLALNVFLFFTLLIISKRSQAQLVAAFGTNAATVNCAATPVNFLDSSTGNPTLWSWDFGDASRYTGVNPAHTYTKPGSYVVKLVVTNANSADSISHTIVVTGPTVQYTKVIDTTCSVINVKFVAKATGGDPLVYTWKFGDGQTSSSISSSVTHPYKAASSYAMNVTVADTNNCLVQAGETLTFGAVTSTLTTTPATLIASRECTDQYGWTNYYFDNNTPIDINDDILLLSINKNNNNIGTLGDGTFQVKVAATANAGTNTGVVLNNPLITNPSGYYVMNRYWSVQATSQPTSPVGVRFYFNRQDVADINGVYPTHDALLEQLIFFKTTNGNPDPVSNINGATGIASIFNGSAADLSHWTYTRIGSGVHQAEFLVANLTGGGGGGTTGNGLALPVKLISFNGKTDNNVAKINWSVTSEINVERFDVEASSDGKTFTEIGQVQPKGTYTTTSDYSYFDQNVSRDNAKFYRLAIVDKDGKKSYSEIIKVSLASTAATLSVFPVPATNSLTISSKAIINKTCSAEIYNYLGLKVMQTSKNVSGNTLQLNINSLPNGSYRIIIFNNNEKIGDTNFIVLR